MKKSIVLFSLVALFATSAFSQRNYSIMGRIDYGTSWALVFEVEDQYNNRPLEGVIIELLDGRSQVAVIKTDYHGRAVILVNEIKYFESGMTVKAYKENYSGWDTQLGSQSDFYSESKRNQFGLLPDDAEYRRQGYLMNPKNMDPGEVLPKILNGDFEYLKSSSSGYGGTGGPGLFVYKFSLDYDRHPSEVRRRSYSSSQSSSSNVRSESNSSSQNRFSNIGEDYSFSLSTKKLGNYIEVDVWKKVKLVQSGNSFSLKIPVIIFTDLCDEKEESTYISLSGRKSGERISLNGEFTMVTKDCLGGKIGYEETKLILNCKAKIEEGGIRGLMNSITNYRGVRGTNINYRNGADQDVRSSQLTISF
ncbi:MAG: hypothetical protein PF542_05365 [Nanoarchaeota archaeon]|jgi:hypothetical protein|nr:hypothetical protein [Nanoarchaeota archaeon]